MHQVPVIITIVIATALHLLLPSARETSTEMMSMLFPLSLMTMLGYTTMICSILGSALLTTTLVYLLTRLAPPDQPPKYQGSTHKQRNAIIVNDLTFHNEALLLFFLAFRGPLGFPPGGGSGVSEALASPPPLLAVSVEAAFGVADDDSEVDADATRSFFSITFWSDRVRDGR